MSLLPLALVVLAAAPGPAAAPQAPGHLALRHVRRGTLRLRAPLLGELLLRGAAALHLATALVRAGRGSPAPAPGRCGGAGPGGPADLLRPRGGADRAPLGAGGLAGGRGGHAPLC